MNNRKLIQRAKRLLKKEPAFVAFCEERGKDIDFVDDVKISFQPLDVSAKTVNEEVILNDKLIGGEMRDIVRYIIHEVTHVSQQEANEVKEKSNKDDYLDDPLEQEAFSNQLEYMDDHYSEEEIQEYLEQLLDHHDIKGKERKEKIRELTKKI